MNLIRNLLGLFVIVLMLNVCMLAYEFVYNIRFDYNALNDDIAFCQLRRVMLIAYDVECKENRMNFIYRNKPFSLSLVNNKLLLQPGTQIFLNDIDELFFEKRDGLYVVRYFREGKEYEKVLCPQAGIYLDNFSDCDVFYDEYHSGKD